MKKHHTLTHTPSEGERERTTAFGENTRAAGKVGLGKAEREKREEAEDEEVDGGNSKDAMRERWRESGGMGGGGVYV